MTSSSDRDSALDLAPARHPMRPMRPPGARSVLGDRRPGPQVSELRVPTWVAVIGMAALLGAWTLLFAGLMGDHVTAVAGGRALLSP